MKGQKPTHDEMERIHYDLDMQYVTFPVLICNIIETIHRIPEEHYESIIDNIEFFEIEHLGYVIPVEQLRKPILILLSKEQKHDVIAHEIAHAVLGHKLGAPFDKDHDQETDSINHFKIVLNL